MPSIASIVDKITLHYPALTLAVSDDFSWSPQTKTVYYHPEAPHADNFLLHELAHALLQHDSYARDIELLKLEREAWDYARQTLGVQFGVTIDEVIAEDSIDTYRDWLHKRSTCPECHLNGVQESRIAYRCVHCQKHWQVNEARTCRLKRTTIKK